MGTHQRATAMLLPYLKTMVNYVSKACGKSGSTITCFCFDRQWFRILCSSQSWRRCFQPHQSNSCIRCSGTSSLISHSSKEAVFKRLFLVAWTALAQRVLHKLFQHGAVHPVRQRNRLFTVVRENPRR